MPPLLTARQLVKRYPLRHPGSPTPSMILAVNDIDIAIHPGETLGLVGESGCGKSTLARLLGLLEIPDAGRIWLGDTEVTALPPRHWRSLRRQVQMVFQDPFASLNPRLPVSAIVAEPWRVHGMGTRREQRERCADLLELVGLDATQMDYYPHEFSGGQRQRIAIARALALEPALLIADEPLSALDVSVQSQILNLLADLKERLGIAYLFISHDLAVVNYLADRVAVMYRGRIVESAPRHRLFRAPSHPYSRALLAAAPTLRPKGKRRSAGIPDESAISQAPSGGCPYQPRCPKAQALCRKELPGLRAHNPQAAEHQVACHFPEPTW
ncbi:MAG: ATP-binding cassette domain-containing protein [Gammaproteobacteria bacterium]|nr:ATP-binding cassette domain-containing protein [Gammaproteobacteria bacterium]MCP5459325.1 ATP-binding cassette domain-containing protein [Gammaproteobacteria bacterium]